MPLDLLLYFFKGLFLLLHCHILGVVRGLENNLLRHFRKELHQVFEGPGNQFFFIKLENNDDNFEQSSYPVVQENFEDFIQ